MQGEQHGKTARARVSVTFSGAAGAGIMTGGEDMLKLTDKIALVTGAGSSGPGFGNGKAIATIFARQGARIIGIDRDPEALAETQRLIEGEGGQLHGACL